MRLLPIRLRLTLWYSVMFATAALLLSCTSWWMLRHTIDASVQQDLQERVDDVRMQLRQLGPKLSAEDAQARFDATYRYRDDGKWLQILDQDGRWLSRSSRMVAMSATLPLPSALPAGGRVANYQQAKRHVRTFSSAVVVDGRAYSVETGAATNKPEALLGRFGLGLLLLTPGVLLAALFAGHIMSRKALAPVTAIANEARRITDRNLDARLPVYETHDEVAHLSITLNSMLARIDAGFRSVRDFTANASHELRTPLARLRTEVEIALLRTRSAEEYRDTLEHLQDVSVDMTSLLEDLLTLARAEAGPDVLRLAPVDVGMLVATTLNEWAPIAERLSLELHCEGITSDGLYKGQSLLVLGDRLGLLRLLRIWLDNACKFTPPGGRVSVTAKLNGDNVVLAVADSGVGIPLEQQERVFERFYRIQGDASRHRTGAGLGLSLAAWIAQQHNTSITLTSIPGEGSRFEILLSRIGKDEQGGTPNLGTRNWIAADQTLVTNA